MFFKFCISAFLAAILYPVLFGPGGHNVMSREVWYVTAYDRIDSDNSTKQNRREIHINKGDAILDSFTAVAGNCVVEVARTPLPSGDNLQTWAVLAFPCNEAVVRN